VNGDEHSGKTQRGRILALLINAREVPLPAILALGIAQYSARIHELRALGFRIENRRERVNGALHTYFRLNGGSAIAPWPAPTTDSRALKVIQGEESLFGDLRQETRHRDDG
jgi:hypothetical protein